MNDLKLHFHDLSRPLPPGTYEQLVQLAKLSFGFADDEMPYCEHWIEATLKRAHLLVTTDGFRASMFASLPERRLLGKRFLWGDGGYVAPELRNQRVPVLIVSRTLDHLGKEQFGWFGGRTQNTYALRMLSHLGFVRPTDGPYTDEEGRAITDYLSREIEQLQGLKDFDPATGVCRKAFPGSLVSAEASVANHMAGISPEDGDVLICVCRLKAC